MKTNEKQLYSALIGAMALIGIYFLPKIENEAFVDIPLQKWQDEENSRSAAVIKHQANKNAWSDEYVQRSNENFHRQIVEFENDGFFSPQVERSFDVMSGKQVATYKSKGLGDLK